jgi:hypothetical protein
MTETAPTQRPLILTVICVVLTIGALMAMQAVFTDDFRGLPRIFRLIYLSSVVLTLFAVLGIMLMRRWGVVVYAAVAVIGQGFLITFGWWNPIQLLLALFISAIGFLYFKQMRW